MLPERKEGVLTDIKKAAQDIINGSKRIKAVFDGPFWDYKTNYNGRRALIRCNGGVTIAIAGMRPPERECDEFYVALEIVNRVQYLVDKEESKI